MVQRVRLAVSVGLHIGLFLQLMWKQRMKGWTVHVVGYPGEVVAQLVTCQTHQWLQTHGHCPCVLCQTDVLHVFNDRSDFHFKSTAHIPHGDLLPIWLGLQLVSQFNHVHKSMITFINGDGEGLAIKSYHVSYQLVNFYRLRVVEIPHTAMFFKRSENWWLHLQLLWLTAWSMDDTAPYGC